MITIQDEIVSFMDLLDLDEELIDKRLKDIMNRNSHDVKHLRNALHLLKYKQLINENEDADCDNSKECQFIVKLFAKSQDHNIEYICKITTVVLSLHQSSLLAKSEHLLQQILPYLFETYESSKENECHEILIKLKICSSILETVMRSGQKVSLLFLETPLEQVFNINNEKLKNFFITNTVSHFVNGVVDYNILDHIWDYVRNQNDNNVYMALRILTSLSEYFLPVFEDGKKEIKYESKLVFERRFWEIILSGMMSNDAHNRRTAIYLMKRVIDYVKLTKIDVEVKSNNCVLFKWESKYEKDYEQLWHKYFILYECLEQKQINIIQPNLKLLHNVKENGRKWRNCVFKLGLCHDNAKVKETCLLCLDSIQSIEEAKMMLNALNSISLFDTKGGANAQIIQLKNLYSDKESFGNIIKAVSMVNWSPVPLFHIFQQMSNIELQYLQHMSASFDQEKLIRIFCDILKIPCNNIVVRKQVHKDAFNVFSHLCRTIHSEDFANLWSILQIETIRNKQLNKLVAVWLTHVKLENEQAFFYFFTSIYTELILISAYLNNEHKYNDSRDYIAELEKKMRKLNNVVSRQYCEKTSCIHEFLYLLSLYEENTNEFNNIEHYNISVDSKCLVQYLTCLLVEDTILNIDDMLLCINNCKKILTTDNTNHKEELLKLKYVCLKIIKDQSCDLHRKLIAINVLELLLSNKNLNYEESFEMKDIICATKHLERNVKKSANSFGRLQNNFYETSCEIIYRNTNDKEIVTDINLIIEFIENVIDCGGYGCLKWILRMMNKIVPIMDANKVEYDIEQFINKMWKEIEELKSNNQYIPCMKEFVTLITQDTLQKNTEHDKTIIYYCRKILESGDVTPTPLLNLIQCIKLKEITIDQKSLVIVLTEILLFAPVKRKDQRKLNGTVAYILKNCAADGELVPTEVEYPFTSAIQSETIQTILNIKDTKVFKHMMKFFRETITSMYKSNKRLYFANSVVHRKIIIALQHMVFMLLVHPQSLDLDEVLPWAIAFLSDLPHEQSVKVYMEWYISLIIYNEDVPLDEKLFNLYNFSKLPQNTRSTILYFVVRQRILHKDFSKDEYHYVMNYLLNLTMGPTFSVRAYAQYMASKLFTMVDSDVSNIYSYTIKVIQETMKQGSNEKLYKSISSDYFISQADIINCLSPVCIYDNVAQFYRVIFDTFNTLPDVADCAKYVKDNNISSNILSAWLECERVGEQKPLIDIDSDTSYETFEQSEDHGLVQTKYVPCRDMTDIDVCAIKPKRECTSDMIIVASLIDKIPNLGGLVRTCEVFGVRTCVINNLRVVQDKQFQCLSVSAESWVDLQEVRPGKSLKDYLQKMKGEGYSLVAAEQTSGSVPLQSCKFTKKTLLLLGHEKEGIPYDLLPLMDRCVEIPQQGVIRSLNVHVTAAIFVWEYCRQTFL